MWEGLLFVNETVKIGKPLLVPEYDLLLSSLFNYVQERRGVLAKRTIAPPAEISRGLIPEVDLNMMPLYQELGYEGPVPGRTVAVPEEGEDFVLDGDILIGITPGGLTSWMWGRKRWPYFKSLIEILVRREESGWGMTDGIMDLSQLPENIRVLILGADHESHEWEHWDLDDGSKILNRVGSYSLPETIHAINQCEVVIGNDCGPAHIASALGKRTYMIFGPTSIVKNRPQERNARIIWKGLWCSPCQFTARWEACNDFECMARLGPEEVLAQVAEYWATPSATDVFKERL